MRCSFCEPLTLQRLLDLTRREFASQIFPPTAFYQHHTSFQDLVASADNGCDLCQLIYRACRCEMPANDDVSEARDADEDAADGKTLLSVIQGLDKTDIKIALNSSKGFLGDAIWLMTRLDVLMVQVGPAWEFPDPAGQPVHIAAALEPVLLNITVHPYYAPIYSGVQRIGRGRLDPDLGSSYNINIARKWLYECREKHENCPSKKESILPTSTRGEYGTLSHCWGGEISTVLSAKTLEGFQKEIKMEDLPANFQDAMVIAWFLGLKYIWIDSLCILQDSKEDWEVESGKMAAIYHNSTVTIAALTSCGSKDGILKGRGQKVDDLSPPTLRLSTDCGYDEHETVMLDCNSKKAEDIWELTPDAPLRRRAWTLQETFLSPRTLYYGSHQLYFHCPQGTESSEGVGGTDQSTNESVGGLSPAIHLRMHDTGVGKAPLYGRGSKSVEMITSEYYGLVEDFTKRKLTFESDKLPAFSGIAESFHRFLGGEYLAGIWTSDLASGLLWNKSAPFARHIRRPNGVPSWSWLVTNEPVSFMNTPKIYKSKEVELVSHDIELKNTQSPYGDINLCSLTVKGLTKKLVSAPRPQSLPEKSVAWFAFDEKESNEEYNQVFRITSEDDDYLLVVANERDSQNVKEDQEAENKGYLVLLVRSEDLRQDRSDYRINNRIDDRLAEEYNKFSLEDPELTHEHDALNPERYTTTFQDDPRFAHEGGTIASEEYNATLLDDPEFAHESDFRSLGSGFLDGNAAWLSGHPLRGMDHGWHGNQPVTREETALLHDDEDENAVRFTGECLLLEKSSLSTEETYKRVGRLTFNPRFAFWETWETQTLKLV